MKAWSDSKLEKAAAGDLDALVALDDLGLLLAPDEPLAVYVARLRELRANLEQFAADLEARGEVDFFGIRLVRADAIPDALGADARQLTKRLYGFSVDWVPGFFTDARLGLLFAGCAFYPQDRVLPVFIVRQAFQAREKWWIYTRTELLAHELTHIAHLGFRTVNYEEHFAFQTATSAFRRLAGGMFRTPRDTYLVLGAMAAVLVAQLVNVRVRPPERVWTMPFPLVFAAGLGAVGWVLLRYLWNRRRLARARRHVAAVFGAAAALPVLFRCSEPEIRELAGLPPAAVGAWCERQAAVSLRWQVIRRKFGRL